MLVVFVWWWVVRGNVCVGGYGLGANGDEEGRMGGEGGGG